MHVNILSYTSGSKQVIGTVTLTGDTYAVESRTSEMDTAKLKASIAAVWAKFPGAAFLRALTFNISGTYYRAELVR